MNVDHWESRYEQVCPVSWLNWVVTETSCCCKPPYCHPTGAHESLKAAGEFLQILPAVEQILGLISVCMKPGSRAPALDQFFFTECGHEIGGHLLDRRVLPETLSPTQQPPRCSSSTRISGWDPLAVTSTAQPVLSSPPVEAPL